MRKHLVENCQRLRVDDVRDAIPLYATRALLIVGTQEITVIGRVTNLHNGYRYCFLCPQCGNAYESLYVADLGSWRCRLCVGAVYASTRKIGLKSTHHENENVRPIEA